MIKQNYYQDLSKMNTFRMKVKARCFVEYDSVADLVELDFEELPKPVMHLGGGSNLLFTDDFRGTVLHSRIRFIEELGEGRVSVGAGVIFDDFCDWAASRGFWGVENLSHIPGEVGASVVQNIGAYGVEVGDVVETVYCYDMQEEEFVHFSAEECRFGYRMSFFKQPEVKGRYIVTHVVYRLSTESCPHLEYGHLKAALPQGEVLTPALIRKTIIEIRKQKLPEPSETGSAGSFFKNPVVTSAQFAEICKAAQIENGPDYAVPHYVLEDGRVKVPAAWMIEQCGWKGRRSGGTAVYAKQPLVLVNYTGEAEPEEIIGLMKRIIASVEKKFGTVLSPEVEII